MGRIAPLTKAQLEAHIAFTRSGALGQAARFHREALDEVLRLQGREEMLAALLRRVKRRLPSDDQDAEAIAKVLGG